MASRFIGEFSDSFCVGGPDALLRRGTQPMPFDGTSYEPVSPVTQMLINGKQQLERGWCQRIMRRRGSVCIIGSLAIVDYDVFAAAQKLLLEAIQEYGYSHSSVADFNDDITRTKEQVLEVYDRAIELSMPVMRHRWFSRELLAA